MNATLTRDGTLGHARPYEFVSTRVLMRHIQDKEVSVCLTVGLRYRDPVMLDRDMSWDSAVRWIEKNGRYHVFEAWYEDDGRLHVQALADGDL